ncbi:MAG: metallophosphoesterase [Planctomycetes bacterium]|nr:metallophosphoesterase [Planctomycetota bacterium]
MRKLLWIAVLAALFLPLLPEPPLHSGPYLQEMSATAVTVAKIDAAPRARGVRVTSEDGGFRHEIQAKEARRRHALRVEGLRPGTRYRYELLDAQGRAGETGEFRTFATSDAAKVRFGVLGDSGGLPWWVWVARMPLFWPVARFDLLPVDAEPGAIGARLAREELDLLVHVGDVIYPHGENRHYRTGWFRPFGATLRRTPCVAVLGNHDLGNREGLDDSHPFLANFVQPRNALTRDERMWSFAHGPVRFVGVDWNRGPIGPDHPALLYLESELARAEEPWVLVFAHYPILSASRQGDRGDLKQHVLPRLRALGVDLLFVGHDHVYQRFGDPGELVQVGTGGGGKSVYEIRGHPEVRVTAPLFHYCVVEVDGPALTLRAITKDGWQLDQLVVDKARLAAEGRLKLDPARARDRRIQALLQR